MEEVVKKVTLVILGAVMLVCFGCGVGGQRVATTSSGSGTGTSATLGTYQVAYLHSNNSSPQPGQYQIYVMNYDGSAQTAISPVGDYWSAHLSSDNSTVLYDAPVGSSFEIFKMATTGGSNFPTASQVTNFPAENDDPQFAPNSTTTIAFDSFDPNSVTANIYTIIGSTQSEIANNTSGLAYFPTFTPDSSKIVYQFTPEGGSNADIYIMNVDGTGQTNLTNSSYLNVLPTVSPDGNYIAFASNRDNTQGFDIYMMPITGSSTPTRLTTSGNNWSPLYVQTSSSPSSYVLVFCSWAGGSYQIYSMDVNGTKAITQLTSGAYNSFLHQ
jgi:Tol biopolymer transport system component